MDAHEAREHLEMVDRILARAEDEPVYIVPGLVIVWGFAAAAIDAGQQLLISGVAGNLGSWLTTAALAVGILYSVAVGMSLARHRRFHRVSRMEERMARMMGAVWFTVAAAAFAQPHVFGGWAGAAVWSMGAAIMMLFAGFDGDRRALAGGLILIGSVLVANYAFPHAIGYVLASGFIFGYAIPGMLFLARPLGAES